MNGEIMNNDKRAGVLLSLCLMVCSQSITAAEKDTMGKVETAAKSFLSALSSAPQCLTQTASCSPLERTILVTSAKALIVALITAVAILTHRSLPSIKEWLFRRAEPAPQVATQEPEKQFVQESEKKSAQEAQQEQPAPPKPLSVMELLKLEQRIKSEKENGQKKKLEEILGKRFKSDQNDPYDPWWR